MKHLFTQAALQRLSIRELRALFASVQHDLNRGDAGPVERSKALACLDAIDREIARKIHTGFKP